MKATASSGAVRHGAECFNLHYPSELAARYLIVWEGFDKELGRPWDNKSEVDVRTFLLDRIDDGFVFPLNPIWTVRDEGWYDVFNALQTSEHGMEALQSWCPPES